MLEYYYRVKNTDCETVLGWPMILLYISSEENMQQLDRWREISEKMTWARINGINKYRFNGLLNRIKKAI